MPTNAHHDPKRNPHGEQRRPPITHVSYGFILPINAPQNMVCLGTETFNAKQFAKVGILVTIIGYALMMLMGMTYWRWLGWL